MKQTVTLMMLPSSCRDFICDVGKHGSIKRLTAGLDKQTEQLIKRHNEEWVLLSARYDAAGFACAFSFAPVGGKDWIERYHAALAWIAERALRVQDELREIEYAPKK